MSNNLIVASITSPKLCGGTSGLNPTAIPKIPLINNNGIFAGKKSGSTLLLSNVGLQSTMFGEPFTPSNSSSKASLAKSANATSV